MATRTHVVIDEDVLRAVDEIAGKRKRSRYIEAAVRERVRRDTLMKVLEESFGILKAEDHPEWETPEQVDAWVRSLRDLEVEKHNELFPEQRQQAS